MLVLPSIIFPWAPRTHVVNLNKQAVVWLYFFPEQQQLADNTVAFSSRAVTGARSYARGETIVFDAEVVNIGGAFDATTSVFVCPVRGLYLFTFTVWTEDNNRMEATLQHNDVSNVVGVVTDANGYNQASNSVLLECQPGQRVKVIAGPVSDDLAITNQNYTPLNTFSGVLLQMLASD